MFMFKTFAAASTLIIGVCTSAVCAQSATPEITEKPAAKTDMRAPRDWSATLIADAQSLRDTVIDSHPGAYDKLNPQFRAHVEQGLADANARAAQTKDAGGWWWALRAYIASFDDGHVQIGYYDTSFAFPTKWPGFLTGYNGSNQIVAVRDESDPATPPVGARLVACDGETADVLAQRRIGTFRGRWFLESQRVTYGSLLFVDIQNPYLTPQRSCQFDNGGQVTTYNLNWRSIDDTMLGKYRQAMAQTSHDDFGRHAVAGGGVWVSMPDFEGDPDSNAYKHLTPLIAQMNTDQMALRNASFIVLDLRGNGGGSSVWSEHIARTLWGDAWIAAHRPAAVQAIDWRASDGNIANMQAYIDTAQKVGGDKEMEAWAQPVITGMKAAKAAGQPYWHQGNDRPEAPRDMSAVNPMHGKVYVITDPICASACLDAVDLWKALGAVQIGRETSADTDYMEVRSEILTSGLAGIAVPTKVWRGRAPGSNVPQRPDHLFDGNMADEAALLTWLQTLK